MSCTYNGEGIIKSLLNGDVSKIGYGFLSYLFSLQQKKGLEIFEQKNERYEASFFKQCAEDGDLSSVPIRLTDKLNRFKSLVKNPDLDPLDESIKDTLMDLANYATMALVYLEAVECNKATQKVVNDNASE